jgi:hypothetical protein
LVRLRRGLNRTTRPGALRLLWAHLTEFAREPPWDPADVSGDHVGQMRRMDPPSITPSLAHPRRSCGTISGGPVGWPHLCQGAHRSSESGKPFPPSKNKIRPQKSVGYNKYNKRIHAWSNTSKSHPNSSNHLPPIPRLIGKAWFATPEKMMSLFRRRISSPNPARAVRRSAGCAKLSAA